jgi:hypothetical protein
MDAWQSLSYRPHAVSKTITEGKPGVTANAKGPTQPYGASSSHHRCRRHNRCHSMHAACKRVLCSAVQNNISTVILVCWACTTHACTYPSSAHNHVCHRFSCNCHARLVSCACLLVCLGTSTTSSSDKLATRTVVLWHALLFCGLSTAAACWGCTGSNPHA